jgi:hypothetical protein
MAREGRDSLSGDQSIDAKGLLCMRPRYLGPLIALAVGSTHCEAPCPTFPCVSPGFAFEITLTGSPAGTPLTTASYRILPSGSPEPCNEGAAANTCATMSGPGTYQVEISAPFYTTVQRTIVVPAKPAARCDCPSNDTQLLTIAMSPTS